MSGVSGNQDADIDVGQLFSAIWERKRRILTTTALACVVALVGSSLMTPAYKAETRILIENRAQNLTGQQQQTTSEPVLDQYNVVSQAQILQSADLIKEVAKQLKLYELKEFDPDAHRLLPDPLVLLHLKQDPMDLAPEERVIKTFREKLQVYPVEGSRIIAIEFSSKDPRLAANIPNRMADVYLSMQSGAKLDTHTEATRWLEPEIANLREKVREAEKKVADYRASNGLFQTSDTASFSAQQLNNISTELARVKADRANAEARAENVRNALKAGRSLDSMSDVVSSAMIQRLKETQINLQSQISDLQVTLMDGHPRLRALRAQLAGIHQQIENETRKILASLENEANVAKLREDQLQKQLIGLKSDSARASGEEVGLRALEREATAQRQLLETYLARYREAASRVDRNSTPADARIVSTAVEPSEAYFPKVWPITIVVGIAALVLQALGIIILGLFSGRGLRFAEETEPMPAAPAVVYEVTPASPVPVVAPVAVALQEEAPARKVPLWRKILRPLGAEKTDHDEPMVAEAHLGPGEEYDQDTAVGAAPKYGHAAAASGEVVRAGDMSDVRDAGSDEMVRSNEPLALPHLSLKAVCDYLVRRDVPLAISVSPTGDEGSTATVMLAREVAEAGQSVVLVDMTGTGCPTRLMAEHRGLPGITDLLCGTTAFGDTLHPDRLSEAHVIPRGTADAAQAMRGADRLTMILDALEGAYGLVIVECGQADVRGLSRLTRNTDAEIILSLPRADEAEIEELVAEYVAEGYANPLVMSVEISGTPNRSSGRQAA